METKQLLAILQRLQDDCPQARGAVLATADGLVLAANGALNDEASAATAAHLAEVVEHHLSFIIATRCDDILVRAASAVWYLTRIADHCVVMVTATPDCSLGMLRLVAKRAGAEVEALL